ncbi:MAG: RNA polymerase sigma factor [Terriglobia bacterium]
MNSDPDDGDLLEGLKDGDEASFSGLYRRHQGAVYRFALHMTGNSSAAEDVTQEVFMTLIRQPQRYDPGRGSLRSFLFGVSRNCVLRVLERERPLTVPMDENAFEESGAADALDLAGDFERSDMIEQVRKAVLALPSGYREVVVLCDLDELSYEEAARVLECPQGTVRSRLHRARALLAAKLSSLRKWEPRTAGQR